MTQSLENIMAKKHIKQALQGDKEKKDKAY